jgi:hypothetical protein
VRPLFLLAPLALAAGWAALATPAAAELDLTVAAPTAIEINLDKSEQSAVVGDRFTVRVRVANPGAATTDRLIAHLNVASLTSDVYVDPEDWSSKRTLTVPALAAAATVDLSWELQAVNAGTFAVYVVVLPAATADTGPLAVSPPVRVSVGGHRTLNAGGALPIVLIVPLLLAGLATVVRTQLGRAR